MNRQYILIIKLNKHLLKLNIIAILLKKLIFFGKYLNHTFIVSFTSSSHITHWLATVTLCLTLFSVIRINTPCSTVPSKVPGYASCMSYLNCIKFQDNRKKSYKLKRINPLLYINDYKCIFIKKVKVQTSLHFILNSTMYFIEITRTQCQNLNLEWHRY